MQAKGNEAFAAKRFDEAVSYFTQAIDVDPMNHVYYSNRSASYASLKQYEKALEDAELCIALAPEWPKAFSRKGAALHGLGRLEEAKEVYQAGLKHDPENALLKEGLKSVESSGRASSNPGKSMFDDPSMMAKIATDPRTRELLQQPDFVAMMSEIQKDPNAISKYLQDPRMMKALSVMMGIDLSAQPAGSTEEPPPPAEDKMEEEAAPAPEPEMSEEEKKEKTDKEKAQEEKARGNELYKQRKFEDAILHYNQAMELDKKDISYLTNRSAVYFEMGEYDKCIEDCDKAVELGRELRADYKLIARAMTRKGNALVKKGDLAGALTVYDKSLMEHRNADTLKRLQEVEKQLKDAEEKAYINPVVATEEKEKGNTCFKEQKYPEAVAHYTEAIKRLGPTGEDLHKVYSNRAACYTKLGAFYEALKDANKCIELEPTFVKGYIRKGLVQFFMKEFDKAMETYQEGLKIEPSNQELQEGVRKSMFEINKASRGELSPEELKQRQDHALADPEIQSILTDPVMRQVLNDFQEDPKAAQQHAKDPGVMAKLQKLVNAGLVQMR